MKNLIAEYRRKLSLTQKQVAREVNVTERLFQYYEYGTVIPSVVVAIRIARVLKTTVEELFPVDEE